MTNRAIGTETITGPMACMRRVEQAINSHDLEALTDCFAPDYRSQFPAHPDRAFQGHEQMRKNWSQIFGAVPDIHATLLSGTTEGDTVWTEWEWKGTRVDGEPFLHRGVTLQGVPRDRITWVRLYMEPVLEGGPGINRAIRQVLTDDQEGTA